MSELNQNKSFNYSSFSEFCFHKDELLAETRHTVEVLLDIANSDYLEAEKVLLNETVLDLECCEISDLTPLATLPNLICLYLSENEIFDLTPLKGLTNLRRIELHNNQIQDITPLQTLINVDELRLSDNYIIDISPLSDLTKLIQLWLNNNRIININPLGKLINIEEIHLRKNHISDIKPLERLINLQYLDLGDNHIKDITPLAKLIKLEYLELNENKIIDIQPLEHLINLSQLYVSKNKINRLNSIFNLQKLCILNVSLNIIKDFDSLQAFKDVKILNIYGNPLSGLVSLNHLINKYKQILSAPFNHKKAIEAVTLAYTNIGLKPPNVIIASNYKSLYTETINLLNINNQRKDSEEKGTIRNLLNKANIDIYHSQNCRLKKNVIQQLITIEFNNSLFITQLQSISQTIKNHLSFEELYLCDDIITTKDILRQIYLIEVYQSLLKIPLDEKTQQWYDCLNQLLEHCGWFIPFEDVCIVCDRPNKFSLDSENRLHAEGEAAIQFADGYGLYYYHGISLPEKYGKVHPSQWQAKWLLSENNAELRRILIQAIGYNRICDELQAIKLDSFREYDLIKIDADADLEPIVLLKMICPSTGYTHVLRVPPNMVSARVAITWVNWDIDPQEFAVES